MSAIKTIVFCVFAVEIFASHYTYKLRKVIWRDHPANYQTIGFRERDGAVMDSARTILSLPFRMETSGLTKRLLFDIWWLRVWRVVFYLVLVPIYLYVAFG